MSTKLWIKQNLKEGEIYAGIVLGKNGQPDHHLILLAATTQPLNWEAAKTWAISVGGELPTPREQAILYGNLKSEFEPLWYWSCEQFSVTSDYAWLQDFGNGIQYGMTGDKVLPEAAAQSYPLTSMRLEWNQRRMRDAMGWPKLVAGVKFENTRAFSRRRRVSALASTLAPATMA